MQQVVQPASLLQEAATAPTGPANAQAAEPGATVAQAVAGASAQPAALSVAAPAVKSAAASPAQPAAQVKSGKPGQHLLKHEVTPEAKVAAIAILGPDPIQAGAAIWELRQPELREMFGRVFGVPTASGNNGWMRGKLMQALGLPGRWHPDDETPKKEEGQVPPSPAGSHGSQPCGDQPEGRKRGRLRQVPARLQQQADDEDSSPQPRARPAKKRAAAAAAAAAPAVPAESYGGGGGASAGSGPGMNVGTHGSGSATSAAAPPPTIVLMMGPGAQLPYWAGGPPDGQPGQPQQLGWAGQPGGPAPGQQVVVLQQQQNGELLQQNGSPQSVEQAALAALQALGMLPAGSALPQGLMPAVLTPPDAAQQQQFVPAPDNAPLILQPGQVGGLPWPIVLPPGGPPGSAAPGSMLWSSILEQQRQQQQQQQQQQLLHLQLQMELQRQMQQQMPPPPPRPPQDNQALQAMQAVDVSNGGAARTPAWSPFDEAAAVPLPGAPSTKQEPDQQAPLGTARQPQHADGGESQFLHQQLLLSGLQPDSSLFAGVEALGWSASFATLSADLHTLFNAWQDGRVSLSLPLPSGLPLPLPSLPSMPPPQT